MKRRLRKLLCALKATFWTGPRMLFTGKLPKRTAAFMIVGAAPAILCALFLTVPAFLFCTPQHQAYFYFGQYLNDNPVSLLPMLVAALCAFLVMAMPAVPSRHLFARR
ncbi:hypothetical protein [Luteolibacter sp. LG18]|uniref:hypothetical protein n=1 Tax=Luteolibacter sp. LG18 TaxID=2819286 RepID=UPI002B2DE484|nr:hypothetical protein llg_33280 [Luteolibacter sp. LG18]